MIEDTTSFPEQFRASVLSPKLSLKDALPAMPYDVGLVVADETAADPDVLGIVTRTRIRYNLRQGTFASADPVTTVMAPFQDLDPSSTELREKCYDAFYISIYALIQRQIQTKVYNPSNRDGFMNVVFEHIRSRLDQGKYEDCSRRMAFSHWVRTVANNKIIDELRKLPDAETVEGFRTSVRNQAKASATNPLRALNEGDVFRILTEAIADLPDKQKLAITYNIQYPDQSGQDIAASLGMSVNAFHLNLNRARDKLQAVLTERAPAAVHKVKQLRNRPRNEN